MVEPMRALFITEYSPFGTDFGAQQRSYLLLKALEEIGTVDVLMLRNGRETAVRQSTDRRLVADATYEALPMGVRKYAPSVKLTRMLSRWLDLRSYDVICGRYLEPISKLDLPAGTSSVVDLDDVGYSYASNGTLVSRTVAAGGSLLRWRLERAALKRFSRYWFVCERDRRRFPGLPGAVLPNVPVGAVRTAGSASAGSTLLFVGALWYAPNRQGIERFLAACWPRIREAEPAARLRLVGAAPVADREQWSRVSGVEATGFVRDVTAEYAGAAFTIAPIYSGGGSNIKVLESLAQARACVTTAYCLERFRPHFRGTSDIVATADDAAMAQKCIELLREPERREALARAGQEIVMAQFNYDAFRRVVHEQVQFAMKGSLH
jgi:glycosyltransferase involved in cell wall biosynthesis